MPTPDESTRSDRKPMPILARHAVSLSVAFALALVLSYFVAQVIHQHLQLNKLTSPDQSIFERGVGYVLNHAGEDAAVTDAALKAVQTIDAPRAADLLLAVAQSHANFLMADDRPIPGQVIDAIGLLMERLSPEQAIGLYDGLVQIKGIDPMNCAKLLLAQLQLESDAHLLAIVDLLDTRLLWSRQWVPLDLWVRWLGVLSKSDAELTQFNTAKRLGELPEAVDDPRVVNGLATLAASDFETVRNKALHAVAGYAAIAKDPTDYEQIIFNLGSDANTTIARRAWMIVGHLNPLSGFAVDWKSADPLVAEAMLWAAVKTNPENTRPVLEAMRDIKTAALAPLAVGSKRPITFDQLSSDPAYQDCLSLKADRSNQLTVWRTILAIGPGQGTSDGWLNYLRSHLKADTDATSMAPLPLASIYRLGTFDLPEGLSWREEMRPIGMLAAVEGKAIELSNIGRVDDTGLPPLAQLVASVSGAYPIDFDNLIGRLPFNEPTLLDLFTLAMTHADESTIDRFIRSANPQMVTMAAIASAMMGDTPRLIDGVDASFLLKHPDLSIEQIRSMTDGDLSELGLKRVDALAALMEAAAAAPPSANRAAEAKLLRLALWIRGDLGDDFTPTAEAMLFDDTLPKSTVLMCLLQMKRPIALNYLFGDLATPRPDLSKLFIQQRYWHLLRQFVDTSDLTLWLWGDPAAQGFQLEAMRQWYTVNRWKIEQGWWPEPQ